MHGNEVANVLSALAIKVRACKEDLSAQEVGNAFYGLKGMSSDVAEVECSLICRRLKA
jgi:hypothetical protein